MSPLGRFLLALAFVASTLGPFLLFMPAARGEDRTPTLTAALAPMGIGRTEAAGIDHITAEQMVERFRVIIVQHARTPRAQCPEGTVEELFNSNFAGVLRVDCIEQMAVTHVRRRHHNHYHREEVSLVNARLAAAMERQRAWQQLGSAYAAALTMVRQGRGDFDMTPTWSTVLANFQRVGVPTIATSLPPHLLATRR